MLCALAALLVAAAITDIRSRIISNRLNLAIALLAPLYWLAGLVTWDTLWAALLALPVTLFANWLGGRHFFGTDPQDFRRFAIILLAGLAALGLGKALI